jgi:UDP:flavonoid glycosyltransferase YjiC (YdhE family)
MAHIHLAWELGAGLGHAGSVKMLAQALLARGHRVSVSLRDLAHTQRLLADLDVAKFQAPLWLHEVRGGPSAPASLAEILFMFGYLDAAALGGLVGGWRALLQQLRPDLLVADYAPTALLAARSLGLASASVGIGFYSPPPGRPLPPLRHWEVMAPGRLQGAEQHLLASVNAVLAGYAAKPFARAAELLLGDQPLLCTWPELDHYGRKEEQAARWYGPSFLARAGEAPQWPAGDGPRVFAYLKSDHPDHAAALRALVDEGCRVLCYLPQVAGGRPAPLLDARLRYAKGPVSLAAAFADSALALCHGGEATLTQALLAGVPLLLMPMQVEQFLIARRVAQCGAALNAAMLPRPLDWRALVRRLLDEPAFAQAARAFALRYRDFGQQAQAEAMVDAFERQLQL